MAETDPRIHRLLGWASLDPEAENINADAGAPKQDANKPVVGQPSSLDAISCCRNPLGTSHPHDCGRWQWGSRRFRNGYGQWTYPNRLDGAARGKGEPAHFGGY